MQRFVSGGWCIPGHPFHPGLFRQAQDVDGASRRPSILDPKLDGRAVVTGLVTPTTMAFLGDDDFVVLEKNTGKVQRVLLGIKRGSVLSLPVNFFSERGLLGIALHPDFEDNGFVYLYWTESSTGTVSADS